MMFRSYWGWEEVGEGTVSRVTEVERRKGNQGTSHSSNRKNELVLRDHDPCHGRHLSELLNDLGVFTLLVPSIINSVNRFVYVGSQSKKITKKVRIYKGKKLFFFERNTF